ncbi:MULTISPECIES: DUF1015 family protein [unclassified Clostridium]|uniref:DUF1015 domain-containing protein n=1 Tax=unclassified Clostridium TaxID=2614128 RepID=UPI001897E17A|nr:MULTISPECIES: DUF1015 family protein [unclassified Clostridium]MBP3914677.1 DUF1015 domain-containing protein [Clostridium sp.]MEE0932489.1 DUF1015 family protein [Clostridium sp.]
MAIIKAFKALRPTQDLASKIAALPYDVMNSEEAREMVKDNEYSFLHVDRAEINLPKETNIYDKVVYEKARDVLDKMIDDGLYVQEEKPCMYIYRQTMKGKSQTGLVICASIDDYINNKIKKHEHTRKDKELDRINHVDYCDANTGPIFLTYRNQDEISRIMDKWTRNRPLYDFISEDGNGHTVWIINNDSDIERLTTLFEKVDSLYIADGHHRAKSAVEVGLKRRKENPGYTGEEEFNYFLAIAYPDNQLEVLDYNRTVKDLNGLSEEEFLNAIGKDFKVKISENPVKPMRRHTFGMYMDNTWYELEAKDGTFNEEDPMDRLDVSILQNNLLSPILGVDDPTKSDRIEFIGGIRGIKELEKRANKDMKVSFSMFATTTDDIMSIADGGMIMPPKSTWFEPKPRSGLFIHKLS